MTREKNNEIEKNLNDWRVKHPHNWIATTDEEEVAEFIANQTNEIVEEQIRSADRITINQECIQHQLEDITLGVQDVVDGIDKLSSKIGWGFSELIWRIEENREVLEKILKTLQNPTKTDAAEDRKDGLYAYWNGFIDDALEYFHNAVEKNRFDFSVHQYIGDIYFHHKENIEQSLEFYQNAAKYAKPKSKIHSSYALLNVAKVQEIKENFIEAKKSTEEAIEISPNSSSIYYRSHYEHGRYLAILNNYQEVLKHLKICFENDSYYAVLVDSEEDFDPMRDKINGLKQEMRNKAKERAQNGIEKIRKIISEVDKRDVRTANYKKRLSDSKELLEGDSFYSCRLSLYKTCTLKKELLEFATSEINKRLSEAKEKKEKTRRKIKEKIKNTPKKLDQKKEKKRKRKQELEKYVKWFFEALLGGGALFLISVLISDVITTPTIGNILNLIFIPILVVLVLLLILFALTWIVVPIVAFLILLPSRYVWTKFSEKRDEKWIENRREKYREGLDEAMEKYRDKIISLEDSFSYFDQLLELAKEKNYEQLKTRQDIPQDTLVEFIKNYSKY